MTSPINAQGWPVGIIMMTTTSNFNGMGNFLPCNGQSVDRTQFNTLFGVIGTTYGSQTGSTFMLPNLNDRRALGKGNIANLAGVGGANTATLQLNTMGAHTHGVNDPGHTHPQPPDHTHSYLACTSRGFFGANGSTDWRANAEGSNTTAAQTVTVNIATTGITLANAGGGQPFNIQNPFLAVNFGIAY